jgi:phage terminase small subunit
MPLSAKQQRFVDEYLLDLNATQAAIRCGYSKKTAYSAGQRLLKHVEVGPELEKALQARAEKTKIDAEWLLIRLAEEATADVNDLYDEQGQLKPVCEWPLIWRQGLVAGIETEHGEDGSTVSKVKLADRAKRLEMLGKHVDIQAFRERIEVTVVDSFAELEKARIARRAAQQERSVH